MKKIIIQIGENMHLITIYLRKLAHFRFKISFLRFTKMSALAILGI
jgi:hypothetical protein